jgi:1,4-dihydroxy-2-naphthoate polyprenyltransferase
MSMAAGGRRDIWVRLLLYPGHPLPTAAAPVLVGTGLAIHDGVFALGPALAALLGSWLIHVGGVFLDNHELLRRHAAVVEHPELTTAVADGSLRLATLRLAIAACFLLCLVPGVYLVAIGGSFALLLGAIGVVASVGYAGGRWPYTRWGLADPLFFLMFGVVAVAGSYFAQAVSHAATVPDLAAAWRLLPGNAFVVGLPVGALVTCVLVIDDLRDRAFDHVKGWRTPAVWFGPRGSQVEFTLLMAFAYAMPLWFALQFGPMVLLPLATLPWAVAATRRVLRAAAREQLVPMTPYVAKLGAVYALLLGAGLALPNWK